MGTSTADAIHLTRETGRQVADETRTQMETPEGRAARDAAARGRQRVSGAAANARHTASHEWDEAKAATRQRVDATRQRVGSTTHRVQENVQGAAHRVQENVQEGVDRIQHEAQELREAAEHRVREIRHDAMELKEDVGRKAGAVQESARRAASAPRKIGHEMGSALKEAAADYGIWIAALGIAGLLALDALVVLTIWLVAAMSALVGFILGTLLAGLILVVIAVAAYYFGRSKRVEGQHRVQEGVQHSREVVENVQEPVRREFGGSYRGAS